MCVGWVWYLAIDMQLFLITIPILMIYHKRRIVAHIIIFFLQLVCAVYTIVISYQNDMPANMIAGIYGDERYATVIEKMF